MDVTTLESLIQEQIGRLITLSTEDSGEFRVWTPFELGNGDGLAFVLRKDPDGWVFSDEGYTFMHISQWMNDDEYLDGVGAQVVRMILADSEVENRSGELVCPTSEVDLGGGLFRMIQALTRISALAFPGAARSKNSFRQAFKTLASHPDELRNRLADFSAPLPTDSTPTSTR